MSTTSSTNSSANIHESSVVHQRDNSGAIVVSSISQQQPQQQNCSMQKQQSLQEAIIDLYLNVKIRSNQDIVKMNTDQLETERVKLIDISPFIILDYIKSSIEILMNMKYEEHRNQAKPQKKNKADDKEESVNQSRMSESSSREGPPHDYQAMLQKLESQVRTHIRIEQQLKLHIENTQQKVEDLERAAKRNQPDNSEIMEGMKKDNQRLLDLLNLREKEIQDLKAEVDKAAEDARILEERMHRTSQLQKQVIYLQKKYDRDIQKLTKELKSQYKRHSQQNFAFKGNSTVAGSQMFNNQNSGSISHRGQIQNIRSGHSLSKSPHQSSNVANRSNSRTSISSKVKQVDLNRKSQINDRNRQIIKLKGDYSRLQKEAKKQSQLHSNQIKSYNHNYQKPSAVVQNDFSQLQASNNGSESYLGSTNNESKNYSLQQLSLARNMYGHDASQITKLKQKITKLQSQMTANKKHSIERTPQLESKYDNTSNNSYTPNTCHKRSKSQLCGGGNQSSIMKTPDQANCCFDQFQANQRTSNLFENDLLKEMSDHNNKENLTTVDYGGSEEYNQRNVRKSQILYTPSTNFNHPSGANTARQRSASKPRASRPTSSIKDHHPHPHHHHHHHHQQQQHHHNQMHNHQNYTNCHSNSGSGTYRAGGSSSSNNGNSYLSSSLNSSNFKKKSNYHQGATGGAFSGGIANSSTAALTVTRNSTQYSGNYARTKKSSVL